MTTVAAAIRDGGIRAFIPGDASFRLVAETTGSIANDFADKEQRQPGVHKIDRIIGSAALAEFRLRAESGGIRVAEVTY